jgi:hypothetical protein
MKQEQVFQTAREQVVNSYPSIFTKDDVLKLLIDLEKNMESVEAEAEEGTKGGISKEKLQEILRKYNQDLKSHIEYDIDTTDMWSDDKIQLSVSYREICVDDVEIDLDPVVDSIQDFYNDFDIDVYFPEEEESNNQE